MIFVERYEQLIAFMLHHAGGRDKFLHTNAGLAIWLITSLVLHKPLRSWSPLVAVIVLEAANECIDLIAHGPSRWAYSLVDFAITLFWPVLLTVAFRLTPALRR